MKTALAFLLVVLAACSEPDFPTPEPDPTAADADETATPGTYTDAEQAAILEDSIGIVYCDEEPKPEWCSAYQSLEVEDGWAYISSSLGGGDAAFAEGMCADIAAVTYDDDAELIGVTDVQIYAAGGQALADCDVIPI